MNDEERLRINYLIACVASGTVDPDTLNYRPKTLGYDPEQVSSALGIAELPKRNQLINHRRREEIANLFCPGKGIRSVVGATELFLAPVTKVPVTYHSGEKKVYEVKEKEEFDVSREALGQGLANIILGEKVYNFRFDPNKEVIAEESIDGRFLYQHSNIDCLSEDEVKNYAKAIELANVLDLGRHYDQEDENDVSFPYNVLISEDGKITSTNLGSLFTGYKGFVREEGMIDLYGEIITEERARVREVMKSNYLSNLDLITGMCNYVKSLEPSLEESKPEEVISSSRRRRKASLLEPEPRLPEDIVEVLGEKLGF